MAVVDKPTSSYTNLSPDAWEARRPHTSLVIACYRVSEYLPEFMSSLDAQSVSPRDYELIFVIDGCPEDSESVVRNWMKTTEYAVRVVVKPNGGVSTARNAGLSWARGTWISQPDPDDWLESDYLKNIELARSQFPCEHLFVGRPVLRSAERKILEHPLEFKFLDPETRRIDLLSQPEFIQTLGGVAFVRKDLLSRYSLKFDEQLRLSEDADFLSHYLLKSGPSYVLVPTARYDYRTRADGSSIVASESNNIARYEYLFGKAHQRLLAEAGNEAPQWLANVLLYFSFMLFRRNRRKNSPIYFASASELQTIRTLLTENLRTLGPVKIQSFRVFEVPIEVRMSWLSAATGGLHSSPVHFYESQQVKGIERACFYTSEPYPPMGLRLATDSARISNVKSRGVEFLGETWAYQHIVSITPAIGFLARFESDDLFEFELKGHSFKSSTIRRKLGQVKPKSPNLRAAPVRPVFNRIRVRLRSTLSRRKGSREIKIEGCEDHFSEAWVVPLPESGRPGRLSRLFVLLHEAHVRNVWAVLDPGSTSIIPFSQLGLPFVLRGSPEHRSLMSNAKVLLTDQLETPTIHPFPTSRPGQTFGLVYYPDSRLSDIDARVLNTLPINMLLVENEEQARLVNRQGSWFKFSSESVIPFSLPPAVLPRPSIFDNASNTRLLVISLENAFRSTSPSASTVTPESGTSLLMWGKLFNDQYFRDIISHNDVIVTFHSKSEELFTEKYGDKPDWLSITSDPEEQHREIAHADIFLTSYSKKAAMASDFGAQIIFVQFDRPEVLGAPDSPMSSAFSATLGDLGRTVETIEDCANILSTGLSSEHLSATSQASISGNDTEAVFSLVKQISRLFKI